MKRLCLWCLENPVKKPYYQCEECVAQRAGKTISPKYNSAKYLYMAKQGRVHDIEQLNISLKTATNEAEKKAVLHAISKINNEDGRKASLREDLVKATRDNDTQRLKEIHENLGSSYQNA